MSSRETEAQHVSTFLGGFKKFGGISPPYCSEINVANFSLANYRMLHNEGL